MHDIAGLLSDHGLLFVFANVFLTQAGVPMPAVPLMIVAGALAQEGHFGFVPLLGAAIGASLLGDLPWFYAGRRYGYRILRVLCRMAVEPASCVQQTEDKLTRWGAPSLMVAKFIPGFATVAPPLAGATRLALVQFLFFSAIGAGLWAGAAILIGAVFHQQIEGVLAWLSIAGTQALLVLGALLLAYIGVKWIQRLMFIRFIRMARIEAPELKALLAGEQRPVILDARSAAARQADPRRIPGAIPVDLSSGEPVITGLDGDRDVVVYCS
ncbi:MAG TPA: VTT domain-containing protein [Burkholderiales bacterium]|nr:VTT domain-containing protein [Burkholderiales bacterium]